METQKLELMSAISELKLQQAAMERENYELKEEKKRYQNVIVKPPMIPKNSLLMQSPTPPSTVSSSNRMSPTDYPIVRKSSSLFSNQDFSHVGDSSSNQTSTNSFSDSHHNKYLISSTPNNKIVGSSSSSSSSPVMTNVDRQQQQQKDLINYISSVGKIFTRGGREKISRDCLLE